MRKILIDVGQGINVGPLKFGKKNKHRALNKRRASEFLFIFTSIKSLLSFDIFFFKIFQNLINLGPLIRP